MGVGETLAMLLCGRGVLEVQSPGTWESCPGGHAAREIQEHLLLALEPGLELNSHGSGKESVVGIGLDVLGKR